MRRISLATWAWLAVIVLGTVAIYAPGLGNAPVFDDSYLEDGSLFRDYGRAGEWRVRWLSYGSFVWLQALAGAGWWKQRVLNVVLHLGTVLALWALYREVLRHVAATAEPGQAPPAPLHESHVLGFAIACFALNPAAVYAVGYLIQRSIVMATLFTVLALWLVARGLRTGQLLHFALAVVAYVLAVSSKEHAIFAPLAALPVYVMVKRPSGPRLAAVCAGVVALVGAVGLALRARYPDLLGAPFDEFSRLYLKQLGTLDASAPERALPLSIVNEAWLFPQYGLRWMLPFPGWMSVNLRPPFPLSVASFPQVLGPLLYLAIAGGGAWLVLRFRDWRSLAGFALVVPAALFATEFLTVWVQDPFVLYRSYLWAIGIPALVFVLANGAPPKPLAVAAAAVFAFLGWQAIDRVLSLENAERAWSDAIAKLPDDPRAVGRWFPYLNRGTTYVDREEYALALRDFDSSTQLGDGGLGAFNTGAVLAAQGKHTQALAAFERAGTQGYDSYAMRFQRGLSLAATGQLDKAQAFLESALQMDPPAAVREQVLLNVGRVELQLGRNDLAAQHLGSFVAAQPKHKEGRYLLAMAHVMRNEPQKALPLLDELVAEDRAGPAHYARARANFLLKRKPEALADIQAAIERDPRNAELQQWLARIKAMS